MHVFSYTHIHIYIYIYTPICTCTHNSNLYCCFMSARETHKSRGFGFIVFESVDAVDAVCDELEHVIDAKVYIYIYIYTYIHTHTHTYIYIYYIYIYIHTHIYIYIYIYMYIHIYTHVYVCIYSYLCMYSHTCFILRWLKSNAQFLGQNFQTTMTIVLEFLHNRHQIHHYHRTYYQITNNPYKMELKMEMFIELVVR